MVLMGETPTSTEVGRLRVYRVSCRDQLAVYEPQIRQTLLKILVDGEIHEKTVDDAWAEVMGHLGGSPDEAVWLAVDDNGLAAWCSIAVYIGHRGERAGCLSWTWARPGLHPEESAVLYQCLEDFARERGAMELFVTRRSKLKAFGRYLGRFGFCWHCAIFRKDLSHGGIHSNLDLNESKADQQHDAERRPRVSDGHGPGRPKPGRPSGRRPEHSDQHPIAAGDLRLSGHHAASAESSVRLGIEPDSSAEVGWGRNHRRNHGRGSASVRPDSNP